MQKEKRKKILKAYLTEKEYEQIVESSNRTCLSVSTFARNVCLGSKVPSREDAMARRELYKINADLGRLGGLFKLALSENGNIHGIRQLLREIEKRQLELKEAVQRI